MLWFLKRLNDWMILTISLVNANIDWKRKKSYVGYIVQPSFPGSWRCQRRLGSSQQASARAWEPSQRKQGQLPLRWSPSTLRCYLVLENINITSRWRVIPPVAESMNSLSFPSNGWASFNCRPPTWQRKVRQNFVAICLGSSSVYWKKQWYGFNTLLIWTVDVFNNICYNLKKIIIKICFRTHIRKSWKNKIGTSLWQFWFIDMIHSWHRAETV